MEQYLQALVAQKTITSDTAVSQNALDYLQDFFEAHGLHCLRYTSNGYGSLVATVKKNDKTPKVMLAAHIDVVAGSDELFTLREQEGKWLGRGVFDMKFAIASYMQLLDELGNDIQRYDFGIMVTADEETGGLEGVGKLVELGYRPGVCILPDGADNWQIETFAKGLIYGAVHTRGKASHGSRPWEGDSATFKLIDLLSELKQHFADQTLNTNTLNIGIIEGGTTINQTPASASASIDIRYMTPADRENTLAVLRTLCEKYESTFVETEIQGHPVANELTHPLIRPFAESVTRITGNEVSGTVSYGGSDARYLTPVNIPCIICRPPGGNQHADGEWIDKQGAEQYTAVLRDYLNTIAR